MEEKFCFSPYMNFERQLNEQSSFSALLSKDCNSPLTTSLLTNFENSRVKADKRLSQLENCLKQIYEFGRTSPGPYSPFRLKYVFICRKGHKFVSPHLQIVMEQLIYDPYIEYLKKTEGSSVYISDLLGLPEENDLIAKYVRRVLNHVLLEYCLHDRGEEDLRRCRTMSFSDYLRYYQKLV